MQENLPRLDSHVIPPTGNTTPQKKEKMHKIKHQPHPQLQYEYKNGKQQTKQSPGHPKRTRPTSDSSNLPIF